MGDIHDSVTGYRCRGYLASTQRMYHDIAGSGLRDVGNDGSLSLILMYEMSQGTRSEDGDSHPSRHAQWRQIRPYRQGLRAAYRDVVCYVCRSSYLI